MAAGRMKKGSLVCEGYEDREREMGSTIFGMIDPSKSRNSNEHFRMKRKVLGPTRILLLPSLLDLLWDWIAGFLSKRSLVAGRSPRLA